MATFIHPPGRPYPVVSRGRPAPARPRRGRLRLPINTLAVVKITHTDTLSFTARPRFVSGYLAAGLSRR